MGRRTLLLRTTALDGSFVAREHCFTQGGCFVVCSLRFSMYKFEWTSDVRSPATEFDCNAWFTFINSILTPAFPLWKSAVAAVSGGLKIVYGSQHPRYVCKLCTRAINLSETDFLSAMYRECQRLTVWYEIQKKMFNLPSKLLLCNDVDLTLIM